MASDKQWQDAFARLRDYVQRERHTLIPRTFVTDDGFALGAWVRAQRGARKRGYLTAERQRALDSLVFWGWTHEEARWLAGLARLRAFAEQEGHTLVPNGHITADGFRLNRWVRAQRRGREGLTPQRRHALERIPGWVWDPSDGIWQQNLDRLHAFVEREGHARVPYTYVTDDGRGLGLWVSQQRKLCRRGGLSLSRRWALEQLPGWAWDLEEAAWREGLEALGRYVKRKGHARVPDKYTTREGFRLGVWVQTQRDAYRRDKLLADRCVALEQLPGWVWDVPEADWAEWFGRLQAYAAREGHALVSRGHVTDEGLQLGAWVERQRCAFRAGKLAADRQQALEAVPGWVWQSGRGRPDGSRWLAWLERLRIYLQREGHVLVPQSHVTADGYRLGAWVQGQRRAFLQGRLSAERRKALEALPGWEWSLPDASWREGFRQLSGYVDRTGHACLPGSHVTPEGYRLGAWVAKQRVAYHKGELSAERAQLLDDLPGWVWSVKEAAWEEGYRHLWAYAERHGHSRVPKRHVTEDGYGLRRWVDFQRERYRKGKLSAPRQAALERVPDWSWHPQSEAWETGLKRLRGYVSGTGSALVPGSHVTESGFRLGLWVRNQRQAYREGWLAPERQEALEQLPGWVWRMQETA